MLELNQLYNMDCMDGMRQFPDGYFDLAIVDPVYGGVTQGGYMTHNVGQRIGSGKAAQKGYHAELWKQPKTPPEYFKELQRVRTICAEFMQKGASRYAKTQSLRKL